MQLLFANNASTTLAAPISSSATSITVATGTGSLFPVVGASQYFVGTFTDAATGNVREIVWVTARTGDTMTIERAQEGTTAQSWLAGDLFEELLTAGQLAVLSGGGSGITQLTGDVTTPSGSGSQVATLATVNSDVGTYRHATTTLNAKGLTTAAVNGYFTSSPVVIPAAGATVSAAHGLGMMPLGIGLCLVCTTADNGWSIGDTIFINSGPGSLSSGNVNGFQVYANSTDIYAILNSIGFVTSLNKSTGVYVDLTLTSWELVFNAWV